MNLKNKNGLLSDLEIRELSLKQTMITPFTESQSGNGVISYGLTSYGYDIRINTIFKIFDKIPKDFIVDPKNFNQAMVSTQEVKIGEPCLIPPNSFALAETIETFKIPRDILAICVGKSSYARCGLIVNVTPLEPEWTGVLTLEISNTTPYPAKVYAGEGIAQLLFWKAKTSCERSYKDKKGKYQNQKGLTLPIVL